MSRSLALASAVLALGVTPLLSTGCNCNGDGSAESASGSGTSDGTDTEGATTSGTTTSGTTAGSASQGSDGSTGDATAGTDTGGDADVGEISLTIPVFLFEGGITLTANETFQMAQVFDVPQEYGEFVSASFDLEATLPNIDIVRNDGGGDPEQPTLVASLRIAPGDQMNTVCDMGTMEGPVTVIGDANFTPTAIEPSTISASSDALDAVNSGQVSVCFELTADADVTASLSAFAATLSTRMDCDPPTSVAGEWAGTYMCVASGGIDCADEGGPVSLTIHQGNHTAAYIDDGGAFYFGSVCAESFAFSGGGLGYDEAGIFTIIDETTATKTSHYKSWESQCEGDCTDELTRQ